MWARKSIISHGEETTHAKDPREHGEMLTAKLCAAGVAWECDGGREVSLSQTVNCFLLVPERDGEPLKGRQQESGMPRVVC